MSRSSTLGKALTEHKVKPTLVYLRGISNESLIDAISDKISIPVLLKKPTVSVESMQVDKANAKDALLSMFVYKPRQTGFAATAEMTAAAIQQPDSTVIAILPGDNETKEETLERNAVADILGSTNAPIFNNVDEATAYVENAVSEGCSYPFDN